VERKIIFAVRKSLLHARKPLLWARRKTPTKVQEKTYYDAINYILTSS